MPAADGVRHLQKRLVPRNRLSQILQHLRTRYGMVLDNGKLLGSQAAGLVQDLLRNDDLADIMQRRSGADEGDIAFVQLITVGLLRQPVQKQVGQGADVHNMQPAFTVAELHHMAQDADHQHAVVLFFVHLIGNKAGEPLLLGVQHEDILHPAQDHNPLEGAADIVCHTQIIGTLNVDGIPATGNKWLMTDVLRDRWGFDGFVVTDYTAISEMIAHGMGDLQQVSAMSLSAGTDMDMVADGFLTTLEKSLKEGKVTMAEIDKACRRILEAKYKLGLFDDPYKYCDASRVKKDIFTAENRTVARKIATETFVLLKNENNLLPLQRKGKIALVGPLANTKANMPGTWSVAAASDKYNSLYESMKQSLAGKAEVLYAKGSNLMYDAQREAEATMFGREMRDPRSAQELLDEALNVASQADVIVAAVGESSEMSGESSSRTNLEMPDAQRDLLTALKKTGKPVVLVYFAGRSTVMTWEQENFPAILNVWFGGSEAADAICDVVFGDVSPSGKLTTTFPKNVGQIPLYYNHLNTGRPLEAGKWFSKFRSNYLDIDNDPLYPFGYGLSYTTFRYGDLQLSNNSMNERGKITASVTVTNTGNYDADEIVQMYIRDMVGSVARPVKELKGFERIHLKKGESRTVSFDITAKQLKFYNSALNWVCEPGEFEVMVGGNSRDVQTKKFSLQ